MRWPEDWLVLLRVVVGSWFLKAVLTKLTVAHLWGVVPYPAVSPGFLGRYPKLVANFASENPVGWYKEFLETTVLPNAGLFARLQAYGEACVGVGLVLGLLTVLSALVGLFLVVNYGLANMWMGFSQQGFHTLLAASMVILLGSAAGRRWGLDARLRARAGRSRWLSLFT